MRRRVDYDSDQDSHDQGSTAENNTAGIPSVGKGNSSGKVFSSALVFVFSVLLFAIWFFCRLSVAICRLSFAVQGSSVALTGATPAPASPKRVRFNFEVRP